MYTIKQAAARAGVSVPVMRAWERRYGIVAPKRTPAGYRLYDDAAIERVLAMRRLVDDGWQPSQAAREVIDHGPDAATAHVQGPPGVAEGSATATEIEAAAEALISAFVDRAGALDELAVGEALDEMFARGSFEAVATGLLFPALRDLGEAWAAGRLGVAGEHVASHAVLRRLGAALEATGHGRNGDGQVLVGLPPGSRHELGALAFAIAARRAGLAVTYLGPDLPIDDWVAASEGAAAAVIGVVTPHDRAAARRLVERLETARPDLRLALGGPAALPLEGALVLPSDLRAAVRTLGEALAG